MLTRGVLLPSSDGREQRDVMGTVGIVLLPITAVVREEQEDSQ